MGSKKRAWLLIAVLAVVCGGAVGTVAWYRSRPLTTGEQLQRMPSRNAVVLYVDFDALRRTGYLRLLSGSKATEDSDYRTFVSRTGFDYRQDLDSAMVAFAPEARYLLVRGRFDWKNLRSYAQKQGGECRGSICAMPGSTPERRISFLPLKKGLMAMAVSNRDEAVRDMMGSPAEDRPDVPDAPVWLTIPGAALRSGSDLPAGTRMFARSMQDAEKVTLLLVPEGNRLAAKLDIRCRDEKDAGDVAASLTRVTALLRQMIEQEHQKPNAGDLSGLLTAGTFRAEGRRVTGYWPVERALLEQILSGAA